MSSISWRLASLNTSSTIDTEDLSCSVATSSVLPLSYELILSLTSSATQYRSHLTKYRDFVRTCHVFKAEAMMATPRKLRVCRLERCDRALLLSLKKALDTVILPWDMISLTNFSCTSFAFISDSAVTFSPLRTRSASYFCFSLSCSSVKAMTFLLSAAMSARSCLVAAEFVGDSVSENLSMNWDLISGVEAERDRMVLSTQTTSMRFFRLNIRLGLVMHWATSKISEGGSPGAPWTVRPQVISLKVKNPSLHLFLVLAGCLHSIFARREIPTLEPALSVEMSMGRRLGEPGELRDPFSGLASMLKWASSCWTVGEARLVVFRCEREFWEELFERE
mmetsp:Transcript_25626/g.51173  ORF Transcript_25626/g.51173 Transcript_25626/m.51173 type:complete len:336 (+) Transcript_25626:352-1359(+)